MVANPLRSDILFHGYYGRMNTGDDAFIEVASWGALKYWRKSNNVFLCNKNRLPLTCTKVRGYPLSIPKSYRVQSRLLLQFTDYFVSAGGSTLNKKIRKYEIKDLAKKMKESNSNIKLGAIGVSIGPFFTAEDELSTVEYLKSIDFLAVRDEESFKYASSLNLPYKVVNSFDLAALLPNIYGLKNNDKRDKKVIGISVCPYESVVKNHDIKSEHKRNANMVELLKLLDRQSNIHMKFFVINGEARLGDEKLTRETVSLVSPKSFEIIPYSKNTYTMWNQIAKCDFVISTRLHAAIFACFSNTPFMLNEYHRKCANFLSDIDHDESLRLFNNEYEPKEKAKKIIDIIENKDIYSEPKNLEKMKKKAELNFTGVDI
ncbi:polysaccharide pyruvyl transferase family protein [uncultured Halomonas sp.]|uniref:polysaccharide pyruvyl transferase family protein n=1 Tax=uncultured Halomonas sp. TaxID=173971 RepID=UPI002618DA63|nr:polysaccharide pyruvyl transferase family protein [uncultured Halomonas sp.]